jgi:GntR family transcriptional regulator / MocR family aminotransferase
MKRSAPHYPLTLVPKAPNVPSFHWLRDSIRHAILTGMLGPGQRLPATRELAQHYRLSRGTILTAIDDLKSEGYLCGLRGSGTFVCDLLPDVLLQSMPPAAHLQIAKADERPRLSDFGKRLRPFRYFRDLTSLAFRTNLPAITLFPTTLWAQIASRRLRRASSTDLLGSEGRGYGPLRNVLAQYLRASRGVRCEADQIVIVSGVQESLDLVARLLVNPRERVLIEDPGYRGAYQVFDALGARIESVAIDESGAAPAARQFRNARLLYLTPGHQYPTGITMPLKRRVEILNKARESGTLILEDDYDSEYRYSGSPIPAMQGIDKDNLVIFTGSFNKVMFPSLRMGYIVLPPALVEPFVRARTMINRHHSIFDQAIVCDFIENGHFGRHLRRMRNIYAERLAALAYQIEKRLSGALTLSPIEAGLQTIGWLKPGLLGEQLSVAAAARNIDVVPLSNFCHKQCLAEGIQLGFAAVDEAAIEKGVLGLSAAIDDLNRR